MSSPSGSDRLAEEAFKGPTVMSRPSWGFDQKYKEAKAFNCLGVFTSIIEKSISLAE